MEATLTVKHGHRDEALDQLFARERLRIERRLARAPHVGAILHCVLDINPHCQEAYASLTLRSNGHVLNAHGVGPVLATALRDAADELLVELDRWRGHVRMARRGVEPAAGSTPEPFDAERVIEGLLASADTHERPELDRTLRRMMPELHRFAHREIERHRAVLDRPELATIDAADVVEEALVRALAAMHEKPADVPFDRWLFSCVYDVLIDEEEHTLPRRALGSLEDEVPDPVALEGETSGEEIVLRGLNGAAHFIADFLPNLTRAADDEAFGRDVRLAVLQTIRKLPEPSRRVMSMIALEGLEEQEAARRMHCTEAELHAVMDAAREQVRAQLFACGMLAR